MYKVNLEVFQGPMDVLLHLIEKMEIDIHNVKISELTEGYLEYIKSLDKIPIENAEEYIVMAATLMHIKSKRLLPSDDGLEEDYMESEEELLQRLIDYKNYKEIKEVFYELQEQREDFGDKQTEEFLVDSKLMNMPVEKLQLAFKRVLANKNLEAKAEESIRYRREISLTDIREDIFNKIENDSLKYFEDIIESYDSREEIVACFICTLDLLRQGILDCLEEDSKLKIILLK